MDAIKTVSLTKKYKDVTAVDELSLTVKEGELFSLLGVNGAGKTTTIKMLSCLTEPTSGDAFLNGKSIINDTADVKSIIAVSPQETAVAPGLSVKENLELMCGVHGIGKDKRTAKITELTELLGLDTVLKKKAGKLSGGWQRRLSIAMALISSLKDTPIAENVVAFGEIGLAGEIRAVSQAQMRINEAVRLGFKKIILPFHNLKGVHSDEAELIGVRNIRQAFEEISK